MSDPSSALWKSYEFVKTHLEAIVGISGVLLTALYGTISYLQSRRANVLNQKQLDVEDKHADLDLLVYGFSDVTSFVIGLPIKRGTLVEVPVPITIINKGQKSAKEIQVYLKAPGPLCWSDAAEYKFEAPYRDAEFKKHASGNFVTLIWNITSIHPNERHVFNWPMCVPFETTNVRVMENVTMEMALVVNISAAHLDASGTGHSYEFHFLDTRLDKLKTVIRNRNKRILSKKSTQTLKARKPEKRKVVFIEYASLRPHAQHPDDERLAIVEKRTQEVGFALEDDTWAIPSLSSHKASTEP